MLVRNRTASYLSRQKVAGPLGGNCLERISRSDSGSRMKLVSALHAEDRRLRRTLRLCPRSLRDVRGPDGTLSCKETLGHIAFWDDFAARFFSRKLDVRSLDPPSPRDLEERSRAATAAAVRLPYGEVWTRYLEATAALVVFLDEHWIDLTSSQRVDFWIPVSHRRHHRRALARLLVAKLAPVDSESAWGLPLGA